MTALQWLSKTVFTSGFWFTDLIWASLDDIETLRAAITKAENEIESGKRLLSVTHRSARDAPNEVAGLRERAAVTDKREAEFFC